MNARLLLATAATLLAASCLFASKQVTFHGKIETLDGGARRTTLLVERADGSLDSMVVAGNGTFKLRVEADSRLRLTFRQNGYITKVVEVNTLNAFPKFKNENDREVRFSVELMPQSPANDLAFAAPVGHITFTKGSGLMKVHYDHTLVTLPAADVTAAR
ncbi:MAG: hypothetical protein IPM49_11525 [Flavobacteriales bacterium]|nr:hypothetical protein [Flavobacteriales bacterium]